MSARIRIADLERPPDMSKGGILLPAPQQLEMRQLRAIPALVRLARAADAVERERRNLEDEARRASARDELWPMSHTGRELRVACNEYHAALAAFDFDDDAPAPEPPPRFRCKRCGWSPERGPRGD